MAGIRAILLVRSSGVSWERQYAACRTYVERHGYEIVATARSEEDVVGLLRDGAAEVVVAAYDVSGDDHLRSLVESARGRLEYCRTPRRSPPPEPEPAGPGTDEIVRRMARRGGTVDEIVRLLGLPLERVRAILRRQR